VTSAESDYSDNQNLIKEAENKYIDDMISLLIAFSNDVRTILEKSSDNQLLEKFPDWSDELLSIYTMAYGAYDEAVAQKISNTDDADKQAYGSVSSTYSALKESLNKQQLVLIMKTLAEDYFDFLRGIATESRISVLESIVKEELVELAQNDRALVDAGNAYDPTAVEILSVIAVATKRAGLDRVSDAIASGSVAGLFGSLTESLGSTAGGVASCLGASISNVADPATRDLFLRVNSRVQAIQKKEQLAGALTDGNVDSAVRSIDESISRTRRLREQLFAVDV
jgi:hypothetical protein